MIFHLPTATADITEPLDSLDAYAEIFRHAGVARVHQRALLEPLYPGERVRLSDRCCVVTVARDPFQGWTYFVVAPGQLPRRRILAALAWEIEMTVLRWCFRHGLLRPRPGRTEPMWRDLRLPGRTAKSRAH